MSSLFVASLGNPAPYQHTLHSAGHIVLQALATKLNAPSFAASAALAKGLTTETHLRNEQRTRVTLWQSPTYMNESGPALVQAYRAWLKEHGHADARALMGPPKTIKDMTRGNMIWEMRESPEMYRPRMRLVLVHDELEAVPGKFVGKFGGPERSARGHRGVISVVETLVKKGMLVVPDEGEKAVDWDLKRPRPKTERRLSKKKQKRLAREEAAKKKERERENEERRAAGLPELEPEPKPEPEKVEDSHEYKQVQKLMDHPLLARAQIGIGRPMERDAEAVAAFVLSPLEGSQYLRTVSHADTLENFLQRMIAL